MTHKLPGFFQPIHENQQIKEFSDKVKTNHPQVEAYAATTYSPNLVDEWYDVYSSFLGYKDGIVFQTGTETKLYLCNGNLSNIDDVFYRNWTSVYGSDVFPTNF
jgi:hypothetical protein